MLFGASLMGLAGTALGQQQGSKPRFDQVWSKMQLYAGDEDSFFQSFELSGRLQLDLAYVDSEFDNHGEFNVRRFRFGFKTVFLEDFTFHVEGEFNPQEADPAYTRLTDLYLAWSPHKAAKVTAGKHGVGFTLDGMTSSKSLLTVERNNLTNNIWFTEEYIPGLSVKGEARGLLYVVGIFSSGNKDPEFGDFKGGDFTLVTLGHDFADRLGVKEALLRFNWVENDSDPENGFTKPLKDIGSLNFRFETVDWGVRTDLSAAAASFDSNDIWGFVVMPFYRFTESVEFVGRYTYLTSAEENGVRLARYETSISDGLGDRYGEVHFGVNYYWYGHKLKLQTGVQFVDMRDRADDGGAYSGFSLTTGLRVSW